MAMGNAIQHILKLRDAKGFTDFSYLPDASGEGVDIIRGRSKDDGRKYILQYRFNVPQWSYDQALTHLSTAILPEGVKPQDLTEATTSKSVGLWHTIDIELAKEGKIIDAYGKELNVTKVEFLDSMIGAFAEEQARGAGLPALKYSHAQGVDAMGIGHIRYLWWDADSKWLKAKALVHDQEKAANINRGHGQVSLEAGPNDAYGSKIWPWVLDSIAVLPPGTKPAVPGANSRMIAGKDGEDEMLRRRRFVFMAPDGAPGTGGGESEVQGQEEAGDEIVQDLLARFNELAQRLGELEAKVAQIAPGEPGAEEAPPEQPAPEPAAAQQEQTAALAKRIKVLEGRLEQDEIKRRLDAMQDPHDFRLSKGDRERLEEKLEKAESPVEARAILATAEAMAKPIDAASGKRGARVTGSAGQPEELSTEREAHLKEVAEARGIDLEKNRSEAIFAAASIKPPLWRDYEE